MARQVAPPLHARTPTQLPCTPLSAPHPQPHGVAGLANETNRRKIPAFLLFGFQ